MDEYCVLGKDANFHALVVETPVLNKTCNVVPVTCRLQVFFILKRQSSPALKVVLTYGQSFEIIVHPSSKFSADEY